MITELLNPGVLAAALRTATPLLLAALAGAICIKAGVFNIALEGMMLLGAFLAIVLTSLTGSLLLGVLGSVFASVALALIFALLSVTLKADDIIAGLGINMLVLGLTSWLLQAALNSPGGFSDPTIPQMPLVNPEWLSGIPFLSTVLADQHILTYLAWVIAGITYFFVHKSKYGLRLRATGEHPVAARTMGVKTAFWRYLAIGLSGVLAGLAGASMTLPYLRLFTKNMTAGRGFIAFTAATFANGNIIGTALVTFLFAIFSSVSLRLEGFGLPTYFVQMTPYLVTLVTLILAQRRRQSAREA